MCIAVVTAGRWLNNGLKWVIDTTGNLKPWADEAYNIGAFSASTGVGLRPGTVYVAGSTSSDSGFELGKFANNSYELCNDTTNGTVLNGLAVLTTAGCAVKPASAAAAGVIGVAIASPGTSAHVSGPVDATSPGADSRRSAEDSAASMCRDEKRSSAGRWITIAAAVSVKPSGARRRCRKDRPP